MTLTSTAPSVAPRSTDALRARSARRPSSGTTGVSPITSVSSVNGVGTKYPPPADARSVHVGPMRASTDTRGASCVPYSLCSSTRALAVSEIAGESVSVFCAKIAGVVNSFAKPETSLASYRSCCTAPPNTQSERPCAAVSDASPSHVRWRSRSRTSPNVCVCRCVDADPRTVRIVVPPRRNPPTTPASYRLVRSRSGNAPPPGTVASSRVPPARRSRVVPTVAMNACPAALDQKARGRTTARS